MLGKLLKYDLKWTYKVLVVFYVLTLFFAILARALSLIDNSSIFNILSLISCGISVSFMFSILINNMMRLWARFIQNIYKDEAYLTHTLPITKNDIYFSKILCTVITLVTSLIVILLGLVICYYGSDLINFLKSFITEELWSVIGLVILVIVLEVIFVQVVGYLGIVIGYGFNNQKLVKSLLFGFGIYMISSLISLGSLFIYGLINPDMMKMFTSDVLVPDISLLKSILILASILYLIYIILCNIISGKLFRRGVNVD